MLNGAFWRYSKLFGTEVKKIEIKDNKWCILTVFETIWNCRDQFDTWTLSRASASEVNSKKASPAFSDILFVFSIPLVNDFPCFQIMLIDWPFGVKFAQASAWPWLYESCCTYLQALWKELWTVIYSQPVIVCSLLSNRSTYNRY